MTFVATTTTIQKHTLYKV